MLLLDVVSGTVSREDRRDATSAQDSPYSLEADISKHSRDSYARPLSSRGVQRLLGVRWPQHGATVFCIAARRLGDACAMPLHVSFDFDYEDAAMTKQGESHIECSLEARGIAQGFLGGKLVGNDYSEFVLPTTIVPEGLDAFFSRGWQGLTLQCLSYAVSGNGSRLDQITDTSVFNWMPWNSHHDALSLDRLKRLLASANGNETKWQELYVDAIHASLAQNAQEWGISHPIDSPIADFRRHLVQRDFKHSAVRIPAKAAELPYIQVLRLVPWARDRSKLRAYVVNVPKHTERWRALQANFASVDQLIDLRMWPALPLDHPEVRQWDDLLGDGAGQCTGYHAFKSLTLSMKSAWLDWAYAGVGDGVDGEEGGGDNEWALFLEDDVDWHPDVKDRREAIADALAFGLQVAQKEGLAVLGWCEPQLGKLDFWHSEAVVVRRGNGMCAHAMAMTRWRAAMLYDELSLFRSWFASRDVHLDILLQQWIRRGEGRDFGSWGGVYLVGANLSVSVANEPENRDSGTTRMNRDSGITRMSGLLYQDRKRHRSSLGHNAPSSGAESV